MLITRELLIQATELTLADVKAALERSGYKSNSDLRAADFLGMNPNGSFVYEIGYDGGDEELSKGNIYITLRRKVFSKDYEFYAEY